MGRVGKTMRSIRHFKFTRIWDTLHMKVPRNIYAEFKGVNCLWRIRAILCDGPAGILRDDDVS
jgi:hypothetical protein